VELGSGAFETFDTLTSLTVDGIPLSKVDGQVFKGLGALKSLNFLSTNAVFPKDVFASLTSVSELRLSGSGLKSSVSMGAFGKLPLSLRQIHLIGGDLTTVPSEVFQQNGQLLFTHVYLNNNKITEIKPDDFKGAVRVQQIYLDMNPIRSIRAGSFGELKQRKRLFINNGTQLKSFDLSSLNGMNSVFILSLTERTSMELTVTNIQEVPKSLSTIDIYDSVAPYINPAVEELLKNRRMEINLRYSTDMACDKNVHWMAKYACSGSIDVGEATCKDGTSLSEYLEKVVPC